MEQLLIGSVAGALGGNAAARLSPTFNLGTLGNTVAGLLGGGVVSQVVVLLILAITEGAQSGKLSIGGAAAQLIVGGAGGAIVTAIAGSMREVD
ncbi:hypothetical protein [Falsiroseomonas sp. HW251]|uniref:hypothetical protein n=1 Tax=Falsiroseomonas sp. HW251 TaxID=3390998 RepID=UPI003D320977